MFSKKYIVLPIGILIAGIIFSICLFKNTTIKIVYNLDQPNEQTISINNDSVISTISNIFDQELIPIAQEDLIESIPDIAITLDHETTLYMYYDLAHVKIAKATEIKSYYIPKEYYQYVIGIINSHS